MSANQSIRAAGFNHCLKDTFIDCASVNPVRQIKERFKGAAGFSGFDNGLDSSFANSLDRCQTETNGITNGREPLVTGVDVRWQQGKSHALHFANVARDFLGIVALTGQHSSVKMGGVMRFQISRLIGEIGIGEGVRAVKSVISKLRHQAKYFRGFIFRNITLNRAIDKFLFVLSHLLFFLLPHRPSHQIGFTQGIPRQLLR